MNLYDTANQLEQELRQTPEFIALKKAREVVAENEESKNLFSAFQQVQMELQTKQQTGEEFTEEDMKKAQETAENAQGNELINDLMAKEQAFSLIVNDLNRIIMTPVRELYQD
ncbi:YlbF family regulator [Enterococcus timonensis]|uniref:YlbF family regulator n=1 Tax=Enterococcus timonensis TaxID=1852364 RepID=UPI0008DA786F|nr:YlbF family regulator [Enterococcus timonensis]